MQSNEIRRRFLDYFVKQKHVEVASAPLIPHNDPTLYFVNAGMVPFKDVFTGQEIRDYNRATSVQKCLRVSGKHNDLENVGRTPRHHTFFEMLGNFSFGDYFKADAIPMAWEVVTEVFGIDPDRLWVTVYKDDDEAYELWRQLGFPAERLQRLTDDNFWSMGPVGPCGPSSEIFFDHGPSVSADTRGPAGEDDRYVEIWNLVFMQYEQHADGSRTDLPKPSIDTGSGLERVAAVKQGVYSNYDTDLFAGILDRAARAANTRYGANDDIDTALRVIADHSRAAAFAVADGVMPSNEGRGYVLRRIMRRAIRFGVKAEINQLFLHDTVGAVIDQMADAYPQLGQRRDFIEEVVQGEEERFRRTLDKGMTMLSTAISDAGKGGQVSGETAFTLHDTYGFPVDLTELIAEESEVKVDKERFEALLEEQKQRGRANWKGTGAKAVGALWHGLANEHGPTTFTGYDQLKDVGEVIALIKETKVEVKTDDGIQIEVESEQVEHFEPGDEGVVLLTRTPFYAESGGQAGDGGSLTHFTVEDVKKASGLHLHRGVATGPLKVGDSVQAEVTRGRRDDTRRNHTATHLLHAALRSVLGEHVTQKGSLVAHDRLRFDFSHHKPMTADEMAQVERMVNDEILSNKPLTTTLESLDAAIERGAMALFGEKYDDDVRVVSVPGFSVELCGGTHCTATGDIGLFRITSEGGIAAGVRRIEAQTGYGALDVVKADAAALESAAASLKTNKEGLTDALERLQADKKKVEKELANLKKEIAKAKAGDLVGQAQDLGGVKVLTATFDGDLKEQADRLRDQLGTSVVVLATGSGDSVRLVAAVTKDIAGKRIKAGDIIREIAPHVGGRGGGRPDMAQGGGSDPAGIPAALEAALTFVQGQLG